jgi:hypothetical protein
VSGLDAPDLWPWLALAGLGAYHGLNPAMGWLFAVALGLQERSRRAVLRALAPIALGHEASIALVVLLVGGLELVAAPGVLRVAGAVALVLFGLYKFLRPRSHPRWVGMRVTPRELVLWSFLMSSAHGAGLMLFPVLLGLPAHNHADALPAVALGGVAAQDVAAVLLHTLAMLLAMGAVALLVYEKLGLGVLRRAWVNLDLVWAAAVVVAGAATLFT